MERRTQVNGAHVNGPTVGQPDGTKAKRPKNAALEGLRALAIIGIVLYLSLIHI